MGTMRHIERTLIVAAATSLLMLYGCSDEDTVIDNSAERAELQVTALIVDCVSTRVTSESAWENNDQIGISDGSSYTNVPYKYSSSTSKWTAVSETIYAASGATYTAYYPYDSSSVDEDGNITGAKDFLFATATPSTTSSSVSFNFTHRMSKLTIKIFETYSQKDITKSGTIKGLKSGGKFNVKTGATTELTAEDDMSFTSGTPIYLYPQNGAKFTVSFTNYGYTYTVTIDQSTTKFEAGKAYTYTLQLYSPLGVND
jgi:hypothetical protein